MSYSNGGAGNTTTSTDCGNGYRCGYTGGGEFYIRCEDQTLLIPADTACRIAKVALTERAGAHGTYFADTVGADMNAIRLGGEIAAAKKGLELAVNQIETNKLSLINAQKRINRLEREVEMAREQRDEAYDKITDAKMLEAEVLELREYKLAHESPPVSFKLPDGEAW